MEEFLRIFLNFLDAYTWFIVIFFVGINVSYLILIVMSFFHIRTQMKDKDVFGLHGLFASSLYHPISILAPAFNEEATVVASVKSLLQLRFPNYEVIVVNDGSKDRTMDVLMDEFKLVRVKRYVPLVLDHKPIKAIYKSKIYPELIVVDKENGRKADALNAGINVCRNDLFCAIDADCVLEPDVLQTMLRSFIEDETTIAVGGIVRVANDCVIDGNEIKEVRVPKSHLARIQVVEYLRAFLFGRVGWDYLNSLLIISGAFGIFDRNAVLRVGGYLHDTVGEDMELVVRLHRYHLDKKIPYRVRFLPEPVCWTEVPEDRNVLARQRNRWQRGLADTLWRHRRMLLNPKYGRLGMVAMPFFFFFELLAPVVEIFGYVVLVLTIILVGLNHQFAILFLSAAILLGMVLSVASVLCEEFTYRRYPKLKDVLILTLYAFLENFGFRQMHAWWRFKGLVDFLRGNKEWGAMQRKGFNTGTTLSDPKPPVEGAGVAVTDVKGPNPAENTSDEESDNEDKNKDPKSYVGDKTSDFGMYNRDDKFKDSLKHKPVDTDKWKRFGLIGVILIVLYFSVSAKLEWAMQTISGGDSTVLLGDSNKASQDSSNDFNTISSLNGTTATSKTAPETGLSDETSTGVTEGGTRSISTSESSAFESNDIIRWSDSRYYFMQLHTFSSSRRAQLARLKKEELEALGYTVTVQPRVGNSDIILWMVGVNRYRTYWDASDKIAKMDNKPTSYGIQKGGELDMKVFAGAGDVNDGERRYTVVLGSHENAETQRSRAEQWQKIGFDAIRLEDKPPFRIFTGMYHLRTEAEYLAEIVVNKSGERATYIRLE
jgi:cellulose synthase/poly-beta-1,6-N-acetylglucosamine synthase-like glycosyltransferase